MAFIASKHPGSLKKEFMLAAKTNKLKLHYYRHQGLDTIFDSIKKLNRKNSYSGLILSTDERLFNGKTIRYVLRETYRKNRTVIGFTPSLTKIGALGSVFYSDDMVLESILQLIRDYQVDGVLASPRYPYKAQISTNVDVARSLGINIDSIEKMDSGLN